MSDAIHCEFKLQAYVTSEKEWRDVCDCETDQVGCFKDYDQHCRQYPNVEYRVIHRQETVILQRGEP